MSYFSSGLVGSEDDDVLAGFGWNPRGSNMGEVGSFLLLDPALPIELKGSLLRFLGAVPGVPFFLVDMPRLGGGAINIARGSLVRC